MRLSVNKMIDVLSKTKPTVDEIEKLVGNNYC